MALMRVARPILVSLLFSGAATHPTGHAEVTKPTHEESSTGKATGHRHGAVQHGVNDADIEWCGLQCMYDRIKAKVDEYETRYNDYKNDFEAKVEEFDNLKTAITSLGQCSEKFTESETVEAIVEVSGAFGNGGIKGAAHVILNRMDEKVNEIISDSTKWAEGLSGLKDKYIGALTTDSSTIDVSLLKQLPADIFDLMKQNAYAGSAFECALNQVDAMHEILTGEIAEIFAEMVLTVQRTVTELVQTLTGPDSWLSRKLAYTAQLILDTGAEMGLKVEELEILVGGALAKTCQMATDWMLDQTAGFGIDLQDAAPKACAKVRSKTIDSEALRLVAVELWDYIAVKITSYFNEKIFTPLRDEAARILTTTTDAALQAVDGLCGMFPYVGGIICVAVTAGISQVSSWISTYLIQGALDGIIGFTTTTIGNMTEWWVGVVDDGMNQLEAAASDGTEAVAEIKSDGIESVTSFIDEHATPYLPFILPLVALIKLPLDQLFVTLLPNVNAALNDCKARASRVAKSVVDTMCTGSLSEAYLLGAGEGCAAGDLDGCVRDPVSQDDLDAFNNAMTPGAPVSVPEITGYTPMPIGWDRAFSLDGLDVAANPANSDASNPTSFWYKGTEDEYDDFFREIGENCGFDERIYEHRTKCVEAVEAYYGQLVREGQQVKADTFKCTVEQVCCAPTGGAPVNKYNNLYDFDMKVTTSFECDDWTTNSTWHQNDQPANLRERCYKGDILVKHVPGLEAPDCESGGYVNIPIKDTGANTPADGIMWARCPASGFRSDFGVGITPKRYLSKHCQKHTLLNKDGLAVNTMAKQGSVLNNDSYLAPPKDYVPYK